jgi:hypothetical protein
MKKQTCDIPMIAKLMPEYNTYDNRVLRQREYEDKIITRILKSSGMHNGVIKRIRYDHFSGGSDGLSLFSTEWFNSEANFPVALTCTAAPSDLKISNTLSTLFKSTRKNNKNFFVRNILECMDSFPDVECAFITKAHDMQDDIVCHTLRPELRDNEAYLVKKIGDVEYIIQDFEPWLNNIMLRGLGPLIECGSF